jgi:hypothetical protein
VHKVLRDLPKEYKELKELKVPKGQQEMLA